MNPLETSLCGIRLRNPVIAASGTFAYGVEFVDQVKLNELGGLVVKGISRGLASTKLKAG
jgi:dihydroorotate dehydrogenase (NAD+) catalytic subunit